MNRTGHFITFEGIDGAGKSTHITTLADALRAAGHRVTLTREPGGTPLAEKLRHMLLHDSMDALTETLLLFAARRDHLHQVIAPALARGETVLCDRFTDATFAYQGAGRGFDMQVLAHLERLVQTNLPTIPPSSPCPDESNSALLQPHLTLWFDLPPATADSRITTTRAPATDRFETESLAFFTRVAQGYSARAAAAPHRFVRLDAALSLPQVAQHMLAAVAQRGWLTGCQ